MPPLSTPRLAAVLAVILALFGTGVAAGAAGAALILGQVNSSGSSTTTLNATTSNPTLRVNNNGTGRGVEIDAEAAIPLRLTAPGGTPPLSVNTTAKVTNLNADRLDGLNSTSFVRTNAAVQGHHTCNAMDMMPTVSSDTWGYTNNGRYFTSGGGGTLTCAVHLPDGATVQSVTVHMRDNSATEAGSCVLYREDFLSASEQLNMAFTGTTLSEVVGDISRTDASVMEPTIDNGGYRYFVLCPMSGTGTDITVYGATLTYSVTGLPVE